MAVQTEQIQLKLSPVLLDAVTRAAANAENIPRTEWIRDAGFYRLNYPIGVPLAANDMEELELYAKSNAVTVERAAHDILVRALREIAIR